MISGKANSHATLYGSINLPGGNSSVSTRTTDEWNALKDLIAQKGTIYIYSDHDTVDGKPVPGFKVGDGTTYLIDLPFTDASYLQHASNTSIHITDAEREKWNSKISVSVDDSNEAIIFSTN